MPTWKGNGGKSMTARAGRKQWNAGRAYAGRVEERPIGVDEKEANVRNERSGANHGGVFTAMSDRDRNDQHTNWLLIACIVLLVAAWSVAVWGISAQNAYQSAKGDNRAQHYYGDTYDPECSRVPFLFDDCAPGYVETEQERKTAEYDLAAQNRMADWTAVLVLVSIFGTALSIVGVFLIYSTFQETKRTADAARRANKLARRAFTADQRPWIKLSDIQAAKVQLDAEGTLAVVVSVRPENLGKTPALRVVLQCKLTRIGDIENSDVEEALDAFCETCRRTFEIGRNIAIFPDEKRVPLIETATLEGFSIHQTPVALRLFLCVAYMPSNDRYAMFHTGASVTLDFGAKCPPHPAAVENRCMGLLPCAMLGTFTP